MSLTRLMIADDDPCLAMGMTPNQVRDRYQSICEFAGLGEFVSLPMSTYSTGMAARLRFAVAFARDHDILLIDEALAVGDAEFRKRSGARIQQLRDAAGTVFLVSHAVGVVRETCDRCDLAGEGRDRCRRRRGNDCGRVRGAVARGALSYRFSRTASRTPRS